MEKLSILKIKQKILNNLKDTPKGMLLNASIWLVSLGFVMAYFDSPNETWWTKGLSKFQDSLLGVVFLSVGSICLIKFFFNLFYFKEEKGLSKEIINLLTLTFIYWFSFFILTFLNYYEIIIMPLLLLILGVGLILYLEYFLKSFDYEITKHSKQSNGSKNQRLPSKKKAAHKQK